MHIFHTFKAHLADLHLPRATAAYLILTLILAACGTQPSKPGKPSSIIIEPELPVTTDYRERVQQYEKMAKKASPADQAYYLLLAAETLAENGDFKTIPARLSRLNIQNLQPEYHYRIDLLEAELAYLKNQHPLTLQKLPKNIIDAPPRIQARILRVRALALNAIGYPVESVLTRIQLGPLLGNQQLIDDNNKAIWNILNALPSSTLNELAQNRLNQGLQGWVDLITALRNPQGLSREQVIASWYNHYPAHPAADAFIERLKFDLEFNLRHPNNIALLLPLTGRFNEVAEAVRDGFLAGYYSNESTNKPNIRIYDVGDDPQNIWASLQSAQQEGADIIVGPLSKQSVDEISTAKNLKIPVLGLNYTSNENTHSEKVFQFGLIPEDEARQAAELAIIRGQLNAAVLAPNSAIGERLKNAFVNRYTELSGNILISELYPPNSTDYSQSIKHMLNILQSEVRNSRLRGIIAKDIKFEPRKRSDIDVIFLVADPAQARAIKPQLKFHYADDIPVYTTSQIYSGNTDLRANRDLDGLIYLDTPWTLQGTRDENFKALIDNWPQGMQKNSRLYALGLDAYRVIPFLSQLRSNPNERFSGHTGNLSVDAQNRIHRELLWATFKNGKPEFLEFATIEKKDEDQQFKVMPIIE